MQSSPILILSKIFGCANIFQNNPNEKKKLINYSYRFFILTVLIYAFISQSKLYYSILTSGKLVLTAKVVIEVSLYWSTLYVSYVKLIIKHVEYDNIILQLADYGRKLNFTEKEKRRFYSLSLFLMISVLVFQTTFYLMAWIRSTSDIIIIIGYFLNKFTVNLINYQLSYCLWMLNHCFGKINSQLAVIDDQLKTVHFSCFEKIQIEILKVRCFYQKFMDIGRSINKLYSVHIWLFTITNVVEDICSLNGLFSLQEKCNDDIHCIIEEIFVCLLWFSIFFIPYVVMVASCNAVRNKSRQTSVIIHNIEIKSEDQLLTADLENFSLQMLVNRIQFTGYDCFNIDSTLLLSNASTVATYFVLQGQFANQGIISSYTGF